MKKLSKFLLTLSLAIIFCFGLVFAGCNNDTVSILSIEKTSTVGLVDTYTITYTNGTTSTFTVTNGKNGQDGKDAQTIDIYEIYTDYKNRVDNSITYSQFLKMYLSYNENGIAQTINDCLQSSAKVYTNFYTVSSSFSWGGLSTTKDITSYTGSAIIYRIDSDYTYFITNYHVVYNNEITQESGSQIAKDIVIYLYGSESAPVKTSQKDSNGYPVIQYDSYAISCEYVGGAVSKDIAIIKAKTQDVKNVNANVKAITFASKYYVGETAIAIGNSEDEGISATQGIISVDNEYITLDIDKERTYRSIRIDTSIYSGNSGGGLFNSKGELIGITNAGNETDQNINYAIPVDIVKNTAENLIYYCTNTNTSGYSVKLGLTVVSENSKYVYDKSSGYGIICEDILVNAISQNSIASKLGLTKNDKVVEFTINSTTYSLDRNYQIGDLLLTLRTGDTISFNVVRNNSTISTNTYTIQNSDLVVIE